MISIHAPREGSDGKSSVKRTAHSYFYPRSPRGERQKPKGAIQTMKQFLSTLPARGATQRLPRGGGLCKFLSTLPARGATTATGGLECTSRFLSTLPARGATAKVVLPEPGIPISIHAPREGSDIAKATKLSSAIISIHAPREGSDRALGTLSNPSLIFLSTLPARGATISRIDIKLQPLISIHAPREGSDTKGSNRLYLCFDFYPRSPRGERQLNPDFNLAIILDFYPRSPRGERLCWVARSAKDMLFLSTLPARGATFAGSTVILVLPISIHAPREGSDGFI